MSSPTGPISYFLLFTAPFKRTSHRRESISGTVSPAKSVMRQILDRYSGNNEDNGLRVATRQTVLLLHGPRQEYTKTDDYEIYTPVPDRELLVKILVIGLNPIDWKAPFVAPEAYNFGLPSFPLIAGRDFAGVVVKNSAKNSKFRLGDVILCISTDYRDYRKSAFQEYAIAANFNVCRLPKSFPINSGPPVGVAFVAAILALGVCLGVNFAQIRGSIKGPDLLSALHAIREDVLPEDVRDECLDGIKLEERPQVGDWLTIWGGSTATGFIALQLAKLAGMRVICVVDVEKHGERLLEHGADLLIDRLNPQRAISIISAVTRNNLKFALDTVGRETATLLLRAVKQSNHSEHDRSHLVGLTGLPKEKSERTIFHSVPIKLFHAVPPIGEIIMDWLENLLLAKRLSPPTFEVTSGGLNGVNTGLKRLQTGENLEQRLVVPL